MLYLKTLANYKTFFGIT